VTVLADPPATDARTVDPAAALEASVDRLALHAHGVTVRFGGLTAVDDVAVDIAPGEIVGLIGGNGAGKTTFMNVVSGYVTPDPGAVIQVAGTDIVGLPPEYRPYVDVGRSYQAATLFPGLSVTETLLVAVERHLPTPLLGAILGTGRARRIEREKRERVQELIEACGLQVYAERLVRELSTGTRRVVDLACILAQRPGLLLLDEPTGGLAQRETEAFAPLIRRVQRDLGCAVMVIEHDMVMIGELCDRVYAMETGRVIASGTPDAVRNDPTVIASYLGTDETTIARSGAMAPESPRSAPATEPEPEPSAPEAPAPRRAPLQAPPAVGAMTRAELLAEAGEAGITGRHRMRKDELAAAVVAHRLGAGSRGGPT
jgi:ABC-type branched-subunit amino acid transport system ATPase component